MSEQTRYLRTIEHCIEQQGILHTAGAIKRAAIHIETLEAYHSKLLETCKKALRALRVVYDNTTDDDLLARLDCWPLTELRKAIAEAERE